MVQLLSVVNEERESLTITHDTCHAAERKSIDLRRYVFMVVSLSVTHGQVTPREAGGLCATGSTLTWLHNSDIGGMRSWHTLSVYVSHIERF